MTLPLPIELRADGGELVDELPNGDGWQYEPKWDGFRCLAFRDGDDVDLQSKAGKPLARYFPEVVAALAALRRSASCSTASSSIPTDGALSFDALLLRLHPGGEPHAQARRRAPARFIVFDLLVDAKGKRSSSSRCAERRAALEAFVAEHVPAGERRSALAADDEHRRRPKAGSLASAAGSTASSRSGSICRTRRGERTACMKIKRMRTADCVVGGFRYASKGRRSSGSLLLGLYDDDGPAAPRRLHVEHPRATRSRR